MQHEVYVATANPVRNGVAQVVGHRVTLVPTGERQSDEPSLFGGRIEIYATDPRAGRIFSPGRRFALDLSTVDGGPLEPPAENSTAPEASSVPAAETSAAGAETPPADPSPDPAADPAPAADNPPANPPADAPAAAD